MNDIIYQIEERIHNLKQPEKESLVNMLLLEIETYCRIALALSMDEVTRPDNYLCMANKNLLDKHKNDIYEYFRFGALPRTLGRQLELAENLLAAFPNGGKDCPAHIVWIRKLIKSISGILIQPRNNDVHEFSIPPMYLRNVLNELKKNADGNPYLDEDRVSILVLRPDLAHAPKYVVEVMNFQRHTPDISLAELLRIPPLEDENQALYGPNASIMAPIAIHDNAVYLHVRFSDGTERLHLLSPLLAHFEDREYGIYYKRQNSVFRTSLYISLSSRLPQNQIPTWDDHQQMLFDRAELLKQIVWNSELFDDEDRSNRQYSMKVSQTTDGSNHTYFLNVRKDRMHQTYPELWHAIWGKNQNTPHPEYFNVDVYDNVTLGPLHRMFRADIPPVANPLQVCGQGGVGKTHTVINALFNQFINAKVIDAHCMKFRYVIFLTAKHTMFNTDETGPTYTHWEEPDFRTCDNALSKILRIITDGRPVNAAPRPDDLEDFDETFYLMVHQIRNCLGSDPMLLIIDDLDSVRSADASLTGEAKRCADKEEQRRLVSALKLLTRNNDNCRVIITTRLPLNETEKLLLTPLSPDIALNFASAYFRRSRPAEILPVPYREAVQKIGNGIPAFIMRIVFLLNRSVSSSLDPAQMQKLQHDIADFSLNTTTLNVTGKLIFSILAQMSNALDAVPMGLLKIVLYDETLESINDAIDEMKNWSMIEYRGNFERIALQNDSLILWSQLDEYVELDKRHQCVLDAMRQDNDKWLLDYMIHPGVLMDRAFSALNSKLDNAGKKAFAERIQKLIGDRQNREVFFQGMQNNPAEQKVVAEWISLFLKDSAPEPEPKENVVIPVEVTTLVIPHSDDTKRLLDDLQRGIWDPGAVARLIASLKARDFSLCETQELFLRVIQSLPEALNKAVGEKRCGVEEADRYAETLDWLCKQYDKQTGGRSSEEYLEPFVMWI